MPNTLTNSSRRVLTLPRNIFTTLPAHVPWDFFEDLVPLIQESMIWMPRAEAETAVDYVQPIPCAFIRSDDGRFCVLERTADPTSYLDRKLSLVVGGHVDSGNEELSIMTIFRLNLYRELAEEVRLEKPISLALRAVLVDHSLLDQSPHVAFLYEAAANRVCPAAVEEFDIFAALSGTYQDSLWLNDHRERFDPWSQMVIQNYAKTSPAEAFNG